MSCGITTYKEFFEVHFDKLALPPRNYNDDPRMNFWRVQYAAEETKRVAALWKEHQAAVSVA